MRNFKISASLICGNHLNLEKDIEALAKSGVDLFHFDVMDGVFVPRYGLYPEILKAIKKVSNIPVDVHMMVDNPEPYIEIFAESGADIFFIHAGQNPHIHRVLRKIKANGMKAGIVLDMATPISVLDYISEEIDYVMLMGINAGIVGHKIIPKIYDKISDVKRKLFGLPIQIMIDGGVTPESSPEMIKRGADILVCGTSTIYRPQEGSLEETTQRFINNLNKKLEVKESGY